MVGRALDYLLSVAAPDGGLPFVLPSVRDYPRAPWWESQGDDPRGSLLPRAGIAALLYKNGVEHPWLPPAAEFCWRRIDALGDAHPYEVRSVLPFLEHAPDRPRAEEAFTHVQHVAAEMNR